MKDPILEEALDAIEPIEDEIDCAILNDEQFATSLSNIDNAESTAIEEIDDREEEDLVDPNVDYSEDIHSADMVDMDADDMIAAERDLMLNPFEDDDIIDTAIENDGEFDEDDFDPDDDIAEI